MDGIKRWEMRQELDETVVIIYLDENDSEFASEFLHSGQNEPEDFQHKIQNLLKNKLPSIRKATVKIMVGSTLIATLANLPINNKAYAHETDFNMSYLYFGSTSSFLKQVQATQGNVNTTAPSYFDLNADGSLKFTYQLDQNFINQMHNQGIRVVPFVSNHWDREKGRAALANREQLSTEIAAAVEKYNLDGVNVDIENVSDIDRENYTDFVRLLREKIPKHKEVSVAVAANPNGWTKGWHGSYDYKKLAQYSDYLMIMAYDESYQGGPEGPVASYPWVKKSVEYALKQGVPSEKIVLGLPFFGRYWQEGATTGGYGIPADRVNEMIAKYESTVVYDEGSQSPKAIIKIKETDEPIKISGRTLGPGTYHIWYENEASLQKKVSLVHDYELKGTGSWALGQEDTRIWNNFSVWLAGHGAETDVSSEQQLPPQPSATTTMYTVVAGDTLSRIARNYSTTVDAIKSINNLTSDMIYVGQRLIVPTIDGQTATVVKTGWVQEGANWYFYTNQGQLKKGWLLDRGTWYYLDQTTGVMKTGWLKDAGTWYFLDSGGGMKTGWVQTGGKWYFMNTSGAMRTGWVQTGGKWYFMNTSGAMRTGWVQTGGEWYFMNASGAMQTGWVYTSGKWYYMNASGAMETGWLQLNNKWYYLESSGAMVTGWRLVNSKWYYFYNSGEMAANTTIGKYRFGTDGAWIP
ncbi:glycosyl hydrolase family 18 protein [Bacillus sp. JJ1566]|uniref:glycosyl hydrolase family 18 protein n=1 Tax=Bacillus sp. JJ1566 TaxID=3122961 RepID=UPI003000B8D5